MEGDDGSEGDDLGLAALLDPVVMRAGGAVAARGIGDGRRRRAVRIRVAAGALVVIAVVSTLAVAVRRPDSDNLDAVGRTGASVSIARTSSTVGLAPNTVSVAVSDPFMVASNLDGRGLPWTPAVTGQIVAIAIVNTTAATISTDGRYTLERKVGDTWVPEYRLASAALGNGATLVVPWDDPAPGISWDHRVGSTTDGSTTEPALLFVLPELEPGRYRVGAAITGGPGAAVYGDLFMPASDGMVPGADVRLPPPERRDDRAAFALNQYVPDQTSDAAIMMNRTDQALTSTTEATLQKWQNNHWEPLYNLRPHVEGLLCDQGRCGLLTVPLSPEAQSRPATFEKIDLPIFVPPIRIGEDPRQSIIEESFVFPALPAGRYRIVQNATLADGTVVEVHGRMQKLRPDHEPDITTNSAGYELVEVTAPITAGLTGTDNPHKVLNPPRPGDDRPIPAGEIYRRNAPRSGRSKLYFGRYSIDVPQSNGVPVFHDLPVWLLVTEDKSREACNYAMGGPGPFPGGTTTVTEPHDCLVHIVEPIDPRSGAGMGMTIVGGR